MIKYISVAVLGLFLVACKNDRSSTSNATESTVAEAQKNTETTENSMKPAQPASVPAASVETAKRDTVAVSTLEDLVKNARSNRVLFLEKGTYELEADLVYKMTKDEQRIIDKSVEDTRSIGGQLYFAGLDNFHLVGEKGVKVVSKNPKAVAFFMIRGKNLKVSNITVEKGAEGPADVSYFSNCDKLEIERCKFLGGGTYGIYMTHINGAKVKNSQISGNNTGALRFNSVQMVEFNNTTISNNTCKVPIANFYGNGSMVKFDNVQIINNKRDVKSAFQGSEKLFAINGNFVFLENTTVRDNAGYTSLGLPASNVQKSTIEGVTVP